MSDLLYEDIQEGEVSRLRNGRYMSRMISLQFRARIAQAVERLLTDWKVGGSILGSVNPKDYGNKKW